MAPANRNDRIGRLHHEDIPGMAKTGPDHDAEMLVPVAGTGYDPDSDPAMLTGSPARGFHHPAEAATDQGLVLFCNEAADRNGQLALVLCRNASPDHGNLAHDALPTRNRRPG
jgi:hypothetical protein